MALNAVNCMQPPAAGSAMSCAAHSSHVPLKGISRAHTSATQPALWGKPGTGNREARLAADKPWRLQFLTFTVHVPCVPCASGPAWSWHGDGEAVHVGRPCAQPSLRQRHTASRAAADCPPLPPGMWQSRQVPRRGLCPCAAAHACVCVCAHGVRRSRLTGPQGQEARGLGRA